MVHRCRSRVAAGVGTGNRPRKGRHHGGRVREKTAGVAGVRAERGVFRARAENASRARTGDGRAAGGRVEPVRGRFRPREQTRETGAAGVRMM